MKHSIAVLLLLCSCITTIAQQPERAKNSSLNLETGKNGLLLHLIYDPTFKERRFGVRAGLGSNFARLLNAFSAGGGGYLLFGKKNDYLETGIDVNYLNVYELSDDQVGIALIWPAYTIKTVYGTVNIGYRRYGPRTLFRIGIAPGLIKDGFIRGGYISFGHFF